MRMLDVYARGTSRWAYEGPGPGAKRGPNRPAAPAGVSARALALA